MVNATHELSAQHSRSERRRRAPAAIRVLAAGAIPYTEAVEAQERLWDARRRGEIGDTLLLLQHPPVITLGQNGGLEDLRVSIESLQRMGVELHEANRGGRATFHGPGQLVAYPIVKLPDRDVHAYVWKLEETVLRLLSDWGIAAERVEPYPGVWIGVNKIASVGVAVRDDVTTHGLALNVNTDLAGFDLITPCGLPDRGVTSMQAVLGRALPMAEVAEGFVRSFKAVFTG